MNKFTVQTDHTNPSDECYWEFQSKYTDTVEHEWLVTHGGHHTNHEFNKRAYGLFDKTTINILDIGCGGGNFVEDCINDGHIAAGIDGFNLYTKLKLNAWSRLPDNFIQADVGKPFTILCNNAPVKFDLVTSWECFEHIKTEDVPQLSQNIADHMEDNGHLIFSVSVNQDAVHRSIYGEEWWLNHFLTKGFVKSGVNFYPHVVRDCPGSSFHYLQFKK